MFHSPGRNNYTKHVSPKISLKIYKVQKNRITERY